MPNTLCHIALQGATNRIFLPPHYLIWVVVGCIVPDLPWIWLKILLPLKLFDPYSLRLYCTAQASLLLCTALCAAIAALTRKKHMVFAILCANSLFHLVLDSLQMKWGNGVNITAPFDWTLFSFELFWPEHIFSMIFTAGGFCCMILMWQSIVDGCRKNPQLRLNLKTMTAALAFMGCYLLGPLIFEQSMIKANTYNIRTMQQYEQRVGNPIAFDRARYNGKDKEITIYSGETIHLKGELPGLSGRVSFKGHFTAPDTVQVESYHIHNNYRDTASLIGLFLSCALFIQSLILPGIIQGRPE